MTTWIELKADVEIGDKFWFCFGDVLGEWHEMMLTGFEGPFGAVLTRDEDQYLVHLVDDHTFVLPTGVRGGLPRAIANHQARGATLWRFDVHSYGRTQLERIFAEGDRLLRSGDEHYPAVRTAAPRTRVRFKTDLVPVDLAAMEESDGTPTVALPPRPADSRSSLPLLRAEVPRPGVVGGGVPLSPIDGRLIWMLAEPCKDHKLGDDLTSVVATLPLSVGEHTLTKIGASWRRCVSVLETDATQLADKLIKDITTQLDVVPRKESTLDARILGIREDGGSESAPERYRTLMNALGACEPQEFEDWPLDPPRTTLWCGRETLKAAPTYQARHHKWKSDNKLGEDDPGVVEHEVLSESFDYFLSYDQVDSSNLCGMERLARRMQFIEEGYRQKLEEKRMDKNSGVAILSSFFDGRTKMAGGAIVSPALLKSASESASTRNEILRQQRKAMEVRTLLKGGKAK